MMTTMDAPQADMPRRSLEDRRRDPRHAIAARAVVSPVGEAGQVFSVRLRNLSVTGCSFRTDVPLDEGATFRIDIEVGPMSYSSGLRVVASRQCGYDDYEIGAQFV